MSRDTSRLTRELRHVTVVALRRRYREKRCALARPAVTTTATVRFRQWQGQIVESRADRRPRARLSALIRSRGLSGALG